MENKELKNRVGFEKWELEQQNPAERGYDISNESEKYATDGIASRTKVRECFLRHTNNQIKALQEETLRDINIFKDIQNFIGKDPLIDKCRNGFRILSEKNGQYREHGKQDAPEYAPTKLLLESLATKIDSSFVGYDVLDLPDGDFREMKGGFD